MSTIAVAAAMGLSSSSMMGGMVKPISRSRRGYTPAGHTIQRRPQVRGATSATSSADAAARSGQLLRHALSRAAAVCLALTISSAQASAAAAESFEGVPRIVDGDTLEVRFLQRQLGAGSLAADVQRSNVLHFYMHSVLRCLHAPRVHTELVAWSRSGPRGVRAGGRQEGAPVRDRRAGEQAVLPQRGGRPVSMRQAPPALGAVWITIAAA